MIFQMTTVDPKQTRIRADHNTAAPILGYVPADAVVQGSEQFTAPENLSNANGVYQYKNDVWLKVTYNGITGWMAYIHKGVAICKDYQVIGEEPPPAPSTPPKLVGATITLKYNTGETVTEELQIVKITP